MCGQIPAPKVVAFRRVPGFEIPKDGVWFVNGKTHMAGVVLDIPEGASIVYVAVQGQDGPTTTNYVAHAAQAVPGSLQLVDIGLNNRVRRK